MSDIRISPHSFPTTVLIIDAFKEDRQYWAERVRVSSPQYVVLEADTGAAGFAVCQSQRVDCVILELNLPDTPGFELLVTLVPHALHPEIAVILLSRIEHLAIAELAEDNGAQKFLFKSRASGDQLCIAIQQAIAAVDSATKQPKGLSASKTRLFSAKMATGTMSQEPDKRHRF